MLCKLGSKTDSSSSTVFSVPLDHGLDGLPSSQITVATHWCLLSLQIFGSYL